MADFNEVPYEQGWEKIMLSFNKLASILDKLYKEENIDSSQAITRKEHSEVYT